MGEVIILFKTKTNTGIGKGRTENKTQQFFSLYSIHTKTKRNTVSKLASLIEHDHKTHRSLAKTFYFCIHGKLGVAYGSLHCPVGHCALLNMVLSQQLPSVYEDCSHDVTQSIPKGPYTSFSLQSLWKPRTRTSGSFETQLLMFPANKYKANMTFILRGIFS